MAGLRIRREDFDFTNLETGLSCESFIGAVLKCGSEYTMVDKIFVDDEERTSVIRLESSSSTIKLTGATYYPENGEVIFDPMTETVMGDVIYEPIMTG